ncbi:MAG: hypothetical protein GTO60_04720 [Gammaproteobacteria bacterium]|nr:hypothetical protein [Gammaproteobacteria bacterium]
MKAKYVLVSLLMIAVMLAGTGYGVSAGSGDKATGGGTFVNIAGGWNPSPYADYGDKISFGFNAQGNSAVYGQFHLINHTSGMKAFGTVSEISFASAGMLRFSGTCSIDGVETAYWAEVVDGGEGAWSGYDLVRIRFVDNAGPYDIYGQLSKGNIQKK